MSVLIEYLPAAVLGHLVSGPACTGAITKGSLTVKICFMPAARVTDQVSGANPATGAPVTTVIAPPCAATVIIGG